MVALRKQVPGRREDVRRKRMLADHNDGVEALRNPEKQIAIQRHVPRIPSFGIGMHGEQQREVVHVRQRDHEAARRRKQFGRQTGVRPAPHADEHPAVHRAGLVYRTAFARFATQVLAPHRCRFVEASNPDRRAAQIAPGAGPRRRQEIDRAGEFFVGRGVSHSPCP